MNIIVTTTFPLSEVKEIAERYVKLSPLPEFITSKKVYVRNAVGEGVKIITIYDFEEVRFAEVYKYVYSFMMSYHDVAGFTFSIDVYLEATETLETIGNVLGIDYQA